MDKKQLIIILSFLGFILVAAFVISGIRGAMTGAVSAENCIIECYSNQNCDDNDNCTLDGCAYPGSCAAKCTYINKQDCSQQK